MSPRVQLGGLRDWIKVLHQVVGHPVALHLCSLADKVAGELAIDDPEYGIEAEDFARAQSTLELFDEVIAPCHWLGLAVHSTPAWLGSVHVTIGNHDTDGFERICDDGALWWSVDVSLPADDKYDDSNVEHTETEQEGCPESLVLLHERSSEERQTSDVDASVELRQY